MSGGTDTVQVLVTVKDPDTIIHGAHEFKRVWNARRVRGDNGWESCGGCGAALLGGWSYCPACGCKLQNPEDGRE